MSQTRTRALCLLGTHATMPNPAETRLPKPTDGYAWQTGKSKGQLMGGQDAKEDSRRDQLGPSSRKIPKHGAYYPGGEEYPDDTSSITASLHKWLIPRPSPDVLPPDPYLQPFGSMAMGAPPLGLKPHSWLQLRLSILGYIHE